MLRGCYMVKEYCYELHGITVKIQQKKIKNIYLKVRPPMGDVVLSAPVSMASQEIHALLELRYNWICQQREKIESLGLPLSPEFSENEKHYLWGIAYRLHFRKSEAFSACIEGDLILLLGPHRLQNEFYAKMLDELYRREIKAKIPTLMDLWQERMAVQALDWRVKKMKTRWGTCNTRDKRIWLNLELAKRGTDCLEYVIVHELTHLIERPHSDRFWRLMDGFLPDWRKRRDVLNASLDSGCHSLKN